MENSLLWATTARLTQLYGVKLVKRRREDREGKAWAQDEASPQSSSLARAFAGPKVVRALARAPTRVTRDDGKNHHCNGHHYNGRCLDRRFGQEARSPFKA
jgi:hypothetical protein